MRRRTVQIAGVRLRKKDPVKGAGVAGTMQIDRVQTELLRALADAPEKGGFAAAGAALENDQVVELCIKELFIQPVKTLRAVRAEEEMRMLHGPPPMVLVSTSTYARRRIHV